MKTSKLKNIAGLFIALILTSGTVFSQGRNQGNRSQNQNCEATIPQLTQEQQAQIQTLRNAHQNSMDELRQNRRSTTNAVQKSEIRTEMLKTVEAHHNAVRSLLNEEQQQNFNQLHANNQKGQRQGKGQGQSQNKNGKGQKKGNCNGGGNGNQNGNQTGKGANNQNCRFNS